MGNQASSSLQNLLGAKIGHRHHKTAVPNKMQDMILREKEKEEENTIVSLLFCFSASSSSSIPHQSRWRSRFSTLWNASLWFCQLSRQCIWVKDRPAMTIIGLNVERNGAS